MVWKSQNPAKNSSQTPSNLEGTPKKSDTLTSFKNLPLHFSLVPDLQKKWSQKNRRKNVLLQISICFMSFFELKRFQKRVPNFLSKKTIYHPLKKNHQFSRSISTIMKKSFPTPKKSFPRIWPLQFPLQIMHETLDVPKKWGNGLWTESKQVIGLKNLLSQKLLGGFNPFEKY